MIMMIITVTIVVIVNGNNSNNIKSQTTSIKATERSRFCQKFHLIWYFSKRCLDAEVQFHNKAAGQAKVPFNWNFQKTSVFVFQKAKKKNMIILIDQTIQLQMDKIN